ncbi:MAG TPA: dienelactone hydrolase family protein, partial [Pirellulales bacterium]
HAAGAAFLSSSGLGAASLAAQTTVAQPDANAEGISKDVPWLAEVQRVPSSIPGGVPKLALLLIDSQGRPIDSLAAWKRRREELLTEWEKIVRPLPVERPKAPAWTVLEEDRRDGAIRQRIRYEVAPETVVEAYLLKPLEKLARPTAGVAVFHSTINHSIRQPAGLADDREKAFGFGLAKRGFVTLSPRNFLWPTNEKIEAAAQAKQHLERYPNSTGMARMLLDAQVAIDLLASLPGVDADRIGCVGHSLGAKEALYLPAFDERVKVSVSSEGGVGLPYSNWHAEWYLGKQVHAPDFAREQHELLGLIAPRPFLLLGGDSADGDKSWPFIAAALPVYQLFGEPARLGLFNHKQGHTVPPEAEARIYEWLTTYLSEK